MNERHSQYPSRTPSVNTEPDFTEYSDARLDINEKIIDEEICLAQEANDDSEAARLEEELRLLQQERRRREEPEIDGVDVVAIAEPKKRPIVKPGPREMICIAQERDKRRKHGFGDKRVLTWADTTGLVLRQFFNDYSPVKPESKLFASYILITGEEPERLDRVAFSKFVGIKAEILIENRCEGYRHAPFAGKPIPGGEYSFVKEILRPIERVDSEYLSALRKLLKREDFEPRT